MSTSVTLSNRGRSESLTRGKDLWKLALAALGVVYGDIGTSPLYAMKESFHPGHGLPLTPENVFGIVSLIFWSLMLVVTIKYMIFIMRADNHGEGGITALLALVLPFYENLSKRRGAVVLLGLFGAGLLYGDGIITPAISVLSAVEGLGVATKAFQPIIVPLTAGILIGLFLIQKYGTARIGYIFGPAMLLWLVTLVATGLPWIIRRPEILHAIDPRYAAHFFLRNGANGFFILGAIVLCITGGEALYADMGHFGKWPIRVSWLVLVFPALIVNYFGQGALVLERGGAAIDNTFYSLVSGWVLYPVTAIATVATVIASQALISGAFSLTQQTVQLGYLPRTEIRHTSREKEGQIYVPKVNLFLMVACIGLVLAFQESSNLAAAYGIAVTGTMVITTVFFFVVTRKIWKWSLFTSVLLTGLFLVVDSGFFLANLAKLFSGGWIPILVAAGLVMVMSTWSQGRAVLGRKMSESAIPLEQFFEYLDQLQPHRVKGTAVFMTLTRDIAPATLLHHFRHNQVLHERVILLSIVTIQEPEAPIAERIRITDYPNGFHKIVAKYGYMETPNVPELLEMCSSRGINVDLDQISYYLGRETFLSNGSTRMMTWRKVLFALLSRNARPATEFFGIPADHVIEVGSQIRI